MAAVIEAHNLIKKYGTTLAVDGVGFDVQAGEVFGMVGPNGAGKTTTIECLEGLRRADSGQVRILGLDPLTQREAIAERIGVQLQESNLPARLKTGEALELFGAFYVEPAATADLLERLGLSEKRAAPVSKLSGGQRQRLFIALALVNRPEIVFFDELTTGLDPQARRAMWALVGEIRDQGCTVFLTTHSMEEAERLCDRVAILDRGRIVALDTPQGLIRSLGVENRLVFTVPAGQVLPDLAGLAGVERVEVNGERVLVSGRGRRFTSTVVGALEEAELQFLDLRTEQPNLEDVFLALTGRQIRE